MERNVVSYKGGKVHMGTPGDGRAFPLCRTGGMTNSGTKYRQIDAPIDCRVCLTFEDEPAIIETGMTNQGEGNTMSETTTTVDSPETAEEFAALIERIIVKAKAGEDTAELVTEARAMKDAWKGDSAAKTNKGRKAMLAVIDAAAATPASPAPVSGTVVLAGETGGSLETANDTVDYTTDAELVDLRDQAAEKWVGGIRAHIKVGQMARETARLMIDMRSRIIYKGKPDLKAEGGPARQISKDMAEAVRKALPELSEEEQNQHANAFLTSIRNVMQDEVIKWTRAIEPGSPEAERFAPIIEAAVEERTAALELEAAKSPEEGEPVAGGEGEPEIEPLDVGKVIREAYGYPEVSAIEAKSRKTVEGALADFAELKKVKTSVKKLAVAPGGLSDEELAQMAREIEEVDTELSRRLLALRVEVARRKGDQG